ncbi:GNAT family N-acetyltransferase [Bacillus aerius]|uniref:GNAT family N-acetyltransferase n=1 Tax=Bacillus aerius TaxID=293388 RepID=UPI0028149D9D|nr:GNAT family N-acetyltransferase [Bacillus aerius]WMT29158.1 GNAT family N-acetyltransferase [Bacillus aerius]
MVTLQPMSQMDYDILIEKSTRRYAEEKVLAGTWDQEEAQKNAEEQFARLLPEGLQTEDHELWIFMHEDESIGWVWLCYDPDHPQHEGFIYNFILFEAYRGKGLAKKAMSALEEQAKSLGVKKLSLHVFAHNQIARSLYEKTGFAETGIYMSKPL